MRIQDTRTKRITSTSKTTLKKPILTRPFAAKYINKGTVKTNTDSLIGRKARVTVKINNNLSSGAAVLNGQEWTARAVEDEMEIPEGEIVTVKEIRRQTR